VSWDPCSEPHVQALQVACELILSCSIQGTSGGLGLSWLFSAASPPLPSLCQNLNSDCPFLFPSSFLEEVERGSFLCAEVRSNVNRCSLSCHFRFSCSEYVSHAYSLISAKDSSGGRLSIVVFPCSFCGHNISKNTV